IDDEVIAQHSDEGAVFDIGMDCLRSLWTPWAWVDNKRAIEAAGELNDVVIVAVIPVRANILIGDLELVDVGLSRLDRLLSDARDPILLVGDLQTVPVNSSGSGEVIHKRDSYFIASRYADHRPRNRPIN